MNKNLKLNLFILKNKTTIKTINYFNYEKFLSF